MTEIWLIEKDCIFFLHVFKYILLTLLMGLLSDGLYCCMTKRGEAIVFKKIKAYNDKWQWMFVMIPYQLLTWRIVNPVSCAKDLFCSSDGYGC